ncbi:hypothetical protein BGW41_000232 [Actinomortierella wolfii]|nr:hypothetical protein BGW41_000232 [Actinomortierella wolfii]
MIRLAFVSTLVTLALLSLATALSINYPVRIFNRATGGWVESPTPYLRYGNIYPLVINQKSNGPYGVWRLLDAPDDTNTLENEKTGLKVSVIDSLVMTTEDRIAPSKLSFETIDISVYRIKDVASGLYWTSYDDLVVLRKPIDDESQIWELRPTGRNYFDQFPFGW